MMKINYLSTAYLESIIASVPTVFIWNKDTYLIQEKYKDIFNNFIKVEFCQTSPESATDFVNIIKDNPEEWWNSKEASKKPY